MRAILSAIAEPQTAPTITSGTLLLTLDDDGNGFSVDISDLAPGDTVDRFVVLTNTGTLDAGELGFAITATGDTVLIADGADGITTKALTITIDRCTEAWTVADSACEGEGTESSLLTVRTLGVAEDDGNNATGLTLDSGRTLHLRIRLQLPDQDEVSTNGVLPANSVQGAEAQITVSFRVEQRDPTSTSN